MSYAPVYIPTLCRYEHFRRCIESLSACSLAKQTEVFVALDYPLKPEHQDGWKKIKSYLESAESALNFKQLHIIYRDENYGPFRNEISILEEYIIPYYDRWIMIQDDNEMAPSFLEYINVCLSHFENDKKVLAISGYNWSNYNIKYDNNNWYAEDVFFSEWGYGIWRDRWLECHRKLRSQGYFKKHLYNPRSIFRKWRSGSLNMSLFLNYSMTDRYVYHVYDELMAAYMHLEGKRIIVPVISKTRNHGCDGSGLHCGNNPRFANAPLDPEPHFTLKGNDTHFIENRHVLVNGNYGLRKIPFWLLRRYAGRWNNPFLEEWKEPFMIKVGDELL